MLNAVGRNKSNDIFSNNSTKIFRELILQYQHKRDEGKKISKKLLIKNIQNKIKNIDCDEKDFIIRETRRNIKIKNKIMDNFGDKSLFHIDKVNKIDAKIKIEKSKLLNPFLDYKSHEPISYSSKKNNDKFNSHKIIKFPKIINRANTNNELKSFENKSNTNNNSIPNRSINESYTPVMKYFSPKKDDSKDSSSNYYLNILSESNAISKIKSSPNILLAQSKTPLITDRNNSNIKNKSKKNSFSNIYSLVNMDYINYMQSIKDKFLYDEQKKEKYFEYNKYGCDGFKLKYKFLEENYFK